MLVGYIYYFLNPPLSQRSISPDLHKLLCILHWGSIDFEANRFHIGQWGKEIYEPLADITAHLTESY